MEDPLLPTGDHIVEDEGGQDQDPEVGGTAGPDLEDEDLQAEAGPGQEAKALEAHQGHQYVTEKTIPDPEADQDLDPDLKLYRVCSVAAYLAAAALWQGISLTISLCFFSSFLSVCSLNEGAFLYFGWYSQ